MSNLTHVYNKVIKQGIRPYNPKSKPRIPPSGLGGACERKAYYNFARSPEEIAFPIKSQRITTLGTLLGDHLVDIFRDKKSTIKVIDYVMPDGSPQKFKGAPREEFPVSAEKLFINSGFIDLVFIDKGKLCISEAKSINERGFFKLNPKQPDFKNKVQAVIYYKLFNKLLQEGAYAHISELHPFKKAEELSVLYYNKNDSTLRSYIIDKDDIEDTFRFSVNRILRISKVTDKTQLPVRTEEYCNTCTYKLRCGKNALAPRHGGPISC